MECNPPGSSVHGVLQARILEWVAIPFCRGSSQPRDEPGSPALQADSLPSEPLGKLIGKMKAMRLIVPTLDLLRALIHVKPVKVSKVSSCGENRSEEHQHLRGVFLLLLLSSLVLDQKLPQSRDQALLVCLCYTRAWPDI